MSDYIKRDDAIKAVANNYWHGTECECYAFAHKALDGIQSADVAPVRHGRWDSQKDKQVCSLCGAEWYYFENDVDMFGYCPRCGAVMDEEVEA